MFYEIELIPLSRDPSEIILICWFGSKVTFSSVLKTTDFVKNSAKEQHLFFVAL